MIQEVLQQTTTTTSVYASEPLATDWLQILLVFFAGVGVIIGILGLVIQHRERSRKRSRAALEPLTRTLREMRSDLQKGGKTRDVLQRYFEEIDSKGYEVHLRKVGKLPELFRELKSRVKEIQDDAYKQSGPWFFLRETYQHGLDLMISADSKVKRTVEQITIEIDKMLQKAEGA